MTLAPEEFFMLHRFCFTENNHYESANEEAIKKALRNFWSKRANRSSKCLCVEDINGEKCKLETCVNLRGKIKFQCHSECGQACQNQKWRRDQMLLDALTMRWVNGHGLAPFTTRKVPAGSYICEFVGKFVKEPPENSNYFIKLQTLDLYLDCAEYGNESGFIRRSSTANCEIQEFLFQEGPRAVVVSKRGIEANEELTLLSEEKL